MTETVLVYERVRQACAASGLKQKVIADRLGESKYWLSDRLTGRVVLAADDVVRFAAVLGVPVTVFFGAMPAPGEEPVRPALPPPPPPPALGEEADDFQAVLRVYAMLMETWNRLPDIEQQIIKEMAERRRDLRERVIEAEPEAWLADEQTEEQTPTEA